VRGPPRRAAIGLGPQGRAYYGHAHLAPADPIHRSGEPWQRALALSARARPLRARLLRGDGTAAAARRAPPICGGRACRRPGIERRRCTTSTTGANPAPPAVRRRPGRGGLRARRSRGRPPTLERPTGEWPHRLRGSRRGTGAPAGPRRRRCSRASRLLRKDRVRGNGGQLHLSPLSLPPRMRGLWWSVLLRAPVGEEARGDARGRPRSTGLRPGWVCWHGWLRRAPALEWQAVPAGPIDRVHVPR